MQIDTSSEFGQRVQSRLEEELIIWLTTVTPDDQPVSVPVWFLWQDGSIRIYSQPGLAKLRNIAAHSKVSLNFDGDGQGGNIIQIDAEASIEDGGPTASEISAYAEKYAAGFKQLGMTAEDFDSTSSTAIQVMPTKLRGH